MPGIPRIGLGITAPIFSLNDGIIFPVLIKFPCDYKMKGNFLTNDTLGNKLLAVGICGFVALIAVSYIFDINLTPLMFSLNFTGIATFIFNVAEFVLVCVWIIVGIRLIHYIETLTPAFPKDT